MAFDREFFASIHPLSLQKFYTDKDLFSAKNIQPKPLISAKNECCFRAKLIKKLITFFIIFYNKIHLLVLCYRTHNTSSYVKKERVKYRSLTLSVPLLHSLLPTISFRKFVHTDHISPCGLASQTASIPLLLSAV